MGEITLIPVFEIKPGRLDDFKAAAAAIIERTSQEPDTLRYDQFLSSDGTRMVNIEVFKDADAFVYHNRNVADLVPALFDAGPLTHLEVIGEPSEEMLTELGDADIIVYGPLGSIGR